MVDMICPDHAKCNYPHCLHRMKHSHRNGCFNSCVQDGVPHSVCIPFEIPKPVKPTCSDKINKRAKMLAESILGMQDVMDENTELVISFRKKVK